MLNSGLTKQYSFKVEKLCIHFILTSSCTVQVSLKLHQCDVSVRNIIELVTDPTLTITLRSPVLLPLRWHKSYLTTLKH